MTKLSSLLVGEQSCRFASWIQGHYKIEKRVRDGDLVTWKAKHTEMMNKRVAELKLEGWKVRVESQNFFKMKGNVAIVSGKPDIVATRGAETKVVDCKGGAIMDKNVAQVTIYQNILPLAWGRHDWQLSGEVVYPSAIIPVSYDAALKLREPLFRLIKDLATSTKPDPTPSEMECRFCDVSLTDCPQRFGEGKSVDILTSEF